MRIIASLYKLFIQPIGDLLDEYLGLSLLLFVILILLTSFTNIFPFLHNIPFLPRLENYFSIGIVIFLHYYVIYLVIGHIRKKMTEDSY